MTKQKTIAFATLGCKVNQYDTQALMDLAKEEGYKLVPFSHKADFYVVNSCAVTDSAITKSRRKINQAKTKNPKAKIILCGCWPQTSAKEMPDVSVVTGTKDRKNFLKLINSHAKPVKKISPFKSCEKFEETKIMNFLNRSRAVIKIQEGCRQFCSYCIIPYARGPLRSRKENNVVAQVKKLVKNGYREIVLSGIHLGLYGVDLGSEINLSNLLKKLIKIDGLNKISLSSIEINEVTPELIKLTKNSEKINNHFHIPLQNGSDKILKLMNRPYNTKKFTEKIRKIKKEIPGILITTDVIVGFPSESEKDFQKTYNLCKKLGFAKIHVFSFSRRKETPAYKMTGQIDKETIKKRSLKLRKLSQQLQNNKSQHKFTNWIFY